MTKESGPTAQGTPIIFDGWRSISISLFMALVGYSVMVSVPVLSTAAVEMLGFTEEQVGRVWGADLGGLSLGAVTAALLVARVNRRMLVMAGIAMSIGGNALCLYFVDYETVMWLRVVTGFGSGIFTAVSIASLGATTKPVRAFNMLLLGFSFSAALEMHILPQMSMNGIYLFFISTTAICALFLHWLPSRPLNPDELLEQEKLEDHKENWRVPRYLPLFCLAAVCFTYINIGGYFTYIELAALADGIAQEWVGPLLTWASFMALVGCILALFCARFGLFKPLFVALIAMALLVMMLSGGITNFNIAVSLFSFLALWTFVDVFQSAMLGHMDRTGSLVALMPSVQGFGQFVGPNIAASIIGAGLGYGTMFMVSGSMALVAFFIYLGVFFYMRHRPSAQTEANS